MKQILAIDPGNVRSAWVLYDTWSKKPVQIGLERNETVLTRLKDYPWLVDSVAIEMIASYGMPVGKTVFDTCLWIGIFANAIRSTLGAWPRFIVRKDVKMHLCNSARATDANVSQAIRDRYGDVRQVAIGTKKSPGPLFGFKDDIWAAMAVAITAAETECTYSFIEPLT
jgi:hypothetical protein